MIYGRICAGEYLWILDMGHRYKLQHFLQFINHRENFVNVLEIQYKNMKDGVYWCLK